MGLHQCRQSQFLADGQVFLQLLCRKQCTDQKHRVRSHKLCLINLIGIYGKILPNHRNGNSLPDFPENIIGSQKPLWLRQHRHTVRTCCFIGSGNLCIRELFRNHALGWGCFLYLTDKRHAFLLQSLFKPEISFWKMLRLCADFFRWKFLFSLLYPVRCIGSQFV